MLIIPAIDLINGECVRLAEGEFSAVTRYGDPEAQLRRYEEAGADWVHVVDLDGARAGATAQLRLIEKLARQTTANIQCGGGVRTRADVATLLSAGVSRVIVGSASVKEPAAVSEWIAELGADKICCAFDVRAERDEFLVAISGWRESSGLSLDDVLANYPPGAIRHALVTDISKDGRLKGPNLSLYEKLASVRPDIEFQASGGVSSLDDLARLKRAGAAAAIVGRALYEKRFTVEDARAL